MSESELCDRVIPPLYFALFLLTFGAFGVRWHYQREYFVFQTGELTALVWYFSAFAGAFLVSLARPGLKPAVLCWGFAHLCVLTLLGALELLLPRFPALVPQALADLNPSLVEGGGPKRADMLELLDRRPWVKFKANAWVKSQGSRGEEFAYDWTTDSLGFKNPPAAAAAPAAAVAIGDSFVEGMGVPVGSCWTTLLGPLGYPTYSLGVQGYSPGQAVGALEVWGGRFKPRFVLFGYTPGFENREAILAKVKSPKVFTGGIESIRKSFERGEVYIKDVRHVYPRLRVFNALVDLVAVFRELRRRPKPPADASLRGAAADLESTKGARFDPAGEGFRRTLKELARAKELSDALGARLVVVVFSLRPWVYYEEVTGRSPAPDHYEARLREALLPELKALKIPVLDLLPALRGAVTRWRALGADRGDLLPFFAADGHMNAEGNRVAAAEIAGFLRTLESRTR